MPSDWQNLRHWNGSQMIAFETLCCQLAEHEEVPEGSKFTRKGTPDAGVECFWKLPDGKEQGWQAKFFRSPPDKSQWQQMDSSIKTALKKHPCLISYTFCFPIDRQDPRIDKQEWFMDSWNTHVDKWQEWAQKKGMSVEFVYWGEHEIWERIAQDEHAGRRYFWFNETEFSTRWEKNHLKTAFADVGERYAPYLNVNLPITNLFEGLGRTDEFWIEFKGLYGKIKRSYSNANTEKLIDILETITEENINSSWQNIIEKLLQVTFDNLDSGFEKIDLETIAQLSSQGIKDTQSCIHSLKEANKKYDHHSLYELIKELQALNEFVQSERALLADKPAMLMVGDALVGKTHLFCDIAQERIHKKLPTVLVLGQHLMSATNPWNQILEELGLNCTREEFVGALDAWGQVKNSRVLLMIDALNEGNGKVIWCDRLAGFLEFLKDYPRIGVAMSVKRSDLSSTVSRDVIDKYLVEVTHPGFQGVEYLALSTYCKAFELLMPIIPVISPYFLNPGFLYLLCRGLKNKGENRIPTGVTGFSWVFKNYVDSIHEKLWHSKELNYSEDVNLVQKAVASIVDRMVERGNMWVEYEEAQETVNALLPGRLNDKSLFQALISEGLFAKDRFLDNSEEVLGIRFPYQKFENHVMAKSLFDKYLDENYPSKSFEFDKPLGLCVKDERTCWQNRGLVEAFAIQLPERIKKELPDVAPHCAGYQPVREAFVESLIWRDPKAITDVTLNYIDEHIRKYKDTHDQFFNALLTVASNPDHPYNADFLHKYLMKFELSERDAWWSIFLHHQYGKHEAVDRLVDWAWSSEDKSHIDDESIRLCGIALAWFLTTSNRHLRDRATKALVSLLTNRIHLLRPVIREFLDVNDPYVLERLFAVAYGCAIRSTDDNAISDLAKDVYEWIFKNGEPPPHILLRDYARGVIELALHRGIEFDINVEKIRPPYKSEWPSFEIPEEEELEKYGEWQEDMSGGELAQVDLYHSVMDSGDFALYIIGTNSGPFEWSSRRLCEVKKPTLKDTYDDFVQSLTDRQRATWNKYLDARHIQQMPSKIVIHSALGEDEGGEKIIPVSYLSEEALEKAVESSEHAFHKTLGKKKLKIFEGSVLPYLKDPHKYEKEQFDLSIAQRWILKRVFDLGWTVERFWWFDRNINRYSSFRTAKKPERIGKKYQWIAYHEFLARISDNFEFRGDRESDQPHKYEGPWQIGFVRDIDPSCLLWKTEREKYWNPHKTTWWFTSSDGAWNSEPDDVAWLKSSEDIPKIEPLIEITSPEDGSHWFVLEAFYRWEQPTPPEEDRFEIPRRDMWYMLKSYIVKKSDMVELFKWAKEQNFWGGWMPESHKIHCVFHGEFFWSTAFQYHSCHDSWTDGQDNQIPKQVLVSTNQYMQEDSGYDCSVDETINIYMPAKLIVDKMNLQWNGVDGYFIDGRDNLIAFDPSIRTPGPGALLMNRDTFLNFLDENDYDVLWTLVGEKRIMGDQRSPDGWKGRLELSGVYRIREGNVYGKVYNEKFIPNPRTNSQSSNTGE